MDYRGIEELSKVLAYIASYKVQDSSENKNQIDYSYIDKIANAPTKEILIYYIREALRSYYSVSDENKLNINFDFIEKLIREINNINNHKKLVDISNKISAKALCKIKISRPDNKEVENNE